MPINDIISVILILPGVILIGLASVGIIRLPDFYLRMSAITKAATLGLAMVLIGLSLHFDDLELSVKSLIIISLVMLTAPVGAHAISRAAYKQGVEFWEGAVIDELKQLQKQMITLEKQLKESPGDAELMSQVINALMKLPEEQGGSLRKAEKWALELVKINELIGRRRLAEIYLVGQRWKKLEQEQAIICELSNFETDDVQQYVKALVEQKKYQKASGVIEKALAVRNIPQMLYLGAKVSFRYGVNAPFGLECARKFMAKHAEHPLLPEVQKYGHALARTLHEKW
ncbi:MAG TPA: monovalent cation/H(+) antiporter subunit G [Prolixibacteraceae bacterium]|nr:monovalent cation/H(+) antiporter subunit G [Prolixibacteraceae bacterium]